MVSDDMSDYYSIDRDSICDDYCNHAPILRWYTHPASQTDYIELWHDKFGFYTIRDSGGAEVEGWLHSLDRALSAWSRLKSQYIRQAIACKPAQ